MKKNLILSVWGSCLLAACTSSPQYNLSGTLTGVQSDTLLVRSFEINPSTERQVVNDTAVPLKDGKFALQLECSVLKQVVIMEKPSLTPDMQGRIPAISMDAISFVLLPGKEVVVMVRWMDIHWQVIHFMILTVSCLRSRMYMNINWTH